MISLESDHSEAEEELSDSDEEDSDKEPEIDFNAEKVPTSKYEKPSANLMVMFAAILVMSLNRVRQIQNHWNTGDTNHRIFG